MWQEWARRLKEVNKNNHGFWGNAARAPINWAKEIPGTYEGRRGMAIIALTALGGQATMGGGFGGGAAGSGGFVAGAGGGPALATPSSAVTGGGLFAKLLGGRLNGGGQSGGGGMDWGDLIKTGIGTLAGSYLNKQQAPGKDLSRSPYESGDLQRYLPPELRSGNTGPLIGAGVQGIGELLRNPGGLSPSVLDAIRPRLAEESQSISQNYRGLQANQAGAAARSNTPMSIKNALASALDVAQERAQRSARNEALTASDTMRRGDLEQVYELLNAILAFQQAGRGTATAGIGAGTALQSQRNAAMMALLGSLLQPSQREG
jgi:hypothetical protein